VAGWLLAGCGASGAQPTPVPPSSASPPLATAPVATVGPSPAVGPNLDLGPSPSPTDSRLLGYAFNTGSKDVTLFDAATRQAIETKPLGATVRWLSNEQRFWDGRHVWTYDYPNDRVQAIAVDPWTVSVARTIPAGGKGPAHSLMLTPDRKTAWVNAAGDDLLAVIDLASGQVAAQVKTGKFP